jgi:intracellular septation protein A
MINEPDSVGLRFTRSVGYVLLNFATPLVFYIAFYQWGSKPAIGYAVAVTLVQLLVHAFKKLTPSPLFLMASGFTVLFGSADLLLDDPKYYRLAPAVENMIIAILLWVTYLRGTPLIVYFIRALPKPFQEYFADPSPDGSYMMKVTVAWIIYLFLKAGMFLYLALQYDLGMFVLLRSVFGGLTLGLMLLGEWVYRTHYYSFTEKRMK